MRRFFSMAAFGFGFYYLWNNHDPTIVMLALGAMGAWRFCSSLPVPNNYRFLRALCAFDSACAASPFNTTRPMGASAYDSFSSVTSID